MEWQSVSDSDPPVIVTGASGFLGSHLTRALAVRGRKVVATDLSAVLPPRVLTGVADAQVTYVAGDLCDVDTVTAVLGAADGPRLDVVHAAAVIAFNQLAGALGTQGPTPADVLRTFTVNAAASWRLAAALADDGRLRRLLHVSTRSVFGARPSSSTPIAETEPPRPAGVYGSSKAAAEAGLAALRVQFGLDLVIARVTGVYGPWQGPVSWIGQAVDAIVAGRAYRAAGADDGYELTYVKDTVRGLIGLLEAEHLDDEIYHVSSGEHLTTLREVGAALRAIEPAADVHFADGHASGAGSRTPLQIDRIARELGFAPTWTLRDALADYLSVERAGSYGAEVFARGRA
jgi:nucleoside-diphosphate-sugar epimerase